MSDFEPIGMDATQESSVGGISVKRRNPVSFQEKRRRSFLDRQQTLRRNSVDAFRDLVVVDDTDDDIMVPSEVTGEELAESTMEVDRAIRRRKQARPKRSTASKYGDRLMLPEYFIEVPCDFGDAGYGDGQWLVANRPNGVRCLVIAAQGATVSRGMDGKVIERFNSLLPGGSAASTPGTADWAARGGGSESSKKMYVVLDCIFCPMTRTYYVLDLLNWKGYPLQECTAEFRLFWLSSKFVDDCPREIGLRGHHNDYGVVPLKFAPVTHDSISSLYHSSQSPYVSDGLIFYHKDGHYESGLSPLVLLWQDEMLLSNSGVAPNHTLEASLEFKSWFDGSIAQSEALSEDCNVGTRENSYGLFTAEGYLVHQFYDDISSPLNPMNGDILKCTYDRISDSGAMNGSCFVNFVSLSKVGRCDSSFRSDVHSWSRLLFFNAMKVGQCPHIETVISAAASSPTAMIEESYNRQNILSCENGYHISY